MPIKSIELSVSGHQVKIIQFAAMRGIVIKARLLKIGLPVFAPLSGAIPNLKSAGKSLLDANVSEVLPKALESLAESVDGEVLQKLFKDLLASTWVDGKPMEDENNFNDAFSGNYEFLYMLIIEVIKANRFFALGGIGSLLTK